MAETHGGAIRILLIDDHAVVRAGLRMLIESQTKPKLELVGDTGHAAEALSMAEREQPDIILLDLDLGEENGLDLLPRLLAVTRNSRVIILTGTRDRETHRQALRLGARGLVLKEKAKDVLIRAIEKVHQGESWFDRALLVTVLSKISRRGEDQTKDPEAAKIATLTRREREIIKLVGEGLKNKVVAEQLSISEITVRHHLSSIYHKLEVNDRLELVLYAYRNNLAKPPS